MAFHEQLDEKLRSFIAAQQMFFTASAPDTGGRVNLSPKGVDGLQILDDHTVAYHDLTGSGNETAAHILDNGRLTIMLCSFEGPPRILRLYGRGRVVQPGEADWEDLARLFPERPGSRQVVVLTIESIQTSCGFGVPTYRYDGQRDTLGRWADEKGPDGLIDYRRAKNSVSIDGLPTGLSTG